MFEKMVQSFKTAVQGARDMRDDVKTVTLAIQRINNRTEMVPVAKAATAARAFIKAGFLRLVHGKDIVRAAERAEYEGGVESVDELVDMASDEYV